MWSTCMINDIFNIIMTSSRGRNFTEGNAFIGYQKDTAAAVVLQATQQLEREGMAVSPQRRERSEPVGIQEPRAKEKEVCV